MATTVKLTFLGDLMCQPQQIRAVKWSGRTFDAVFSDVKHLWARSDFVLGNLQTLVAPDESCQLFVKSVVRRDGVSVVKPVAVLEGEMTDSRERERLAMENEPVVNCFRGTGETVEVAEEYTL